MSEFQGYLKRKGLLVTGEIYKGIADVADALGWDQTAFHLRRVLSGNRYWGNSPRLVTYSRDQMRRSPTIRFAEATNQRRYFTSLFGNPTPGLPRPPLFQYPKLLL